jgi:CelD/BcsL family acetyltransferase involved in cellulose biosynthesis
MSRVEEINRIDELASFRASWHALLAATPRASFFHTLEWFEVYWEHYGKGQKLRGLVVSKGGGPIGIVPLVVRTESTRVGPVRVLTYPLHDWGSFYGPIGPKPYETLAAGLAHVRRTPRDWDLLELRWIDAGGVEADLTALAMRAAGLQAQGTVWDRTAVVEIDGSWRAYLAGRTSKWRNNLRRTERKLAGLGRVEHLRYRPLGQAHGEVDPRWDLYDLCEETARQSWQGSSTTGTTLSHDAVRPFLRASHAAAAKAGAVDLNLLLLDGQPLAFAYNYHHRGEVYGLRAGFDATRSPEGAGTLLWARALRDSFRRGDRLYDLGAGYVASKRRFLTRVAPILRYSHFPPAVPRAWLLRAKRWFQARREVRRTAGGATSAG